MALTSAVIPEFVETDTLGHFGPHESRLPWEVS